ncbi:MAG: hypothetical protein LBE09_07920 [Christensenellaceae bacterium]|jgi:primase-polymerase (primpol)-like protein|nr:hypothetical protein [Christensenellaceae bacterium]
MAIDIINELGEKTEIEPVFSQEPTTKKPIPQWIIDRKNRFYENTKKNIPQAMKELKNWCGVQCKYNPTTKHLEKPPVDCNIRPEDNKGHISYAKIDTPSTWCSFDKALAFMKEQNLDAICFALTKESNVFCIDLDKSLESIPDEKTGKSKSKASDLAWKIINTSQNTYAEISMSGKGLHVFGVKSENAQKHPLFTGETYVKSADGTLEIYDSRHFMTVTGTVWPNAKKELKEFRNDSEMLMIAHEKLKDRPMPTVYSSKSTYRYNSNGGVLTLRDVEERIERSKAAREYSNLKSGILASRGGVPDHSLSDLRICSILAWASGGDRTIVELGWQQSGLFRHNKSKNYIDRTINKALSNCHSR